MSIPEGAQIRIREVWDHNARREFELINRLKHKYSTISVDTEFPGLLPPHSQMSACSSCEERTYQSLKANVDSMKLIQVGLTLTNKRGKLPLIDGVYCAWQFNLRDFDITTDMYAEDSIQLLKNSGIDFERNRREGIDSGRFGCLLVKYNLVSNKKIRYVCYQGDYDFAYLLKVLTGECMPSSRAEFTQLVQAFFGSVYDVRCVQLELFNTYCGLERFAEILGVSRIGAAHQAGSDSLLTSSAYQTLKKRYPEHCRKNAQVTPAMDTMFTAQLRPVMDTRITVS